MSDDQRKLTYLRDNVEQLQNKTQSLSSLLYTVQNASDGEAAEIFRRLRTGTDIHVVAEQVQAGQLLFGVGGREAEREFQGCPRPAHDLRNEDALTFLRNTAAT